jgi:hypothetical protein
MSYPALRASSAEAKQRSGRVPKAGAEGWVGGWTTVPKAAYPKPSRQVKNHRQAREVAAQGVTQGICPPLGAGSADKEEHRPQDKRSHII